MILVAGGDSFTYGSELQDGVTPFDPNGTEPPRQIVSKSTFAALTAKELGMDYHCVAYPGYGNSSIRRTVMDACETTQNIGLVLVTWSFPSRYEFRFNYDTQERWGHWYTVTPWDTIDDIGEIKRQFINDNPEILQHHLNHLNRSIELGITDFAKSFYSNVGSGEYWSAYSSLVDVVLLQQYLEIKNIPYVFTMVDECLLNNGKKYHDASMQTLINQLNMDNWFAFPPGTKPNETRVPRGFYQWAVENKYPVGTTHPLEQAHRDAFLHIQDKCNAVAKKNN